MTTKNKRMLYLLAVVVLLAIIYFVLYMPIQSREKAVKQEIHALQEELTTLRTDYDRMDQYKEDIQQMNDSIKDVQEHYPGKLSQERAFRLLFDIEDTFGTIDFSNVSFTDVNLVSSSDQDNNDKTLYFTSQDIATSIDLTYSQLKEFLSYVNDYKDKTKISNMTMVSNGETGKIKLSFIMTMYGLEGVTREKVPVVFDDVNKGNSNPFSSSVSATSEDVEKTQYSRDEKEDLFLSVKPIVADGYAYIIGLADDVQKTSFIEKESHKPVTVFIRVYESNDAFYFDYNIDSTYKNKQLFDIEKTIEATVYSSERTSKDDEITMNVSIVNETDQPFVIHVIDEDNTNPRFNVISTNGEVIIE